VNLVWPHGDEEQLRRYQAPENEVPAVLPISTVLARTDGSAIVLTGVEVFSTGVAFTVILRCRPDALPADEVDLGQLMWRRGPGSEAELLVGVEFADGRRTSSLSGRDPFGAPVAPETLVLTRGRGTGDQLSVEQEWWLTPLPPAGPLRLVVRCGLFGLPEASVELDGAAIRAAAEDVVVLWPWAPPRREAEAEPPALHLPADSWFGSG
jgi:hypothetical protein